MPGNDAIHANPPSYPIDITTHGSDWLWAVFATMLATGLGVSFWSLSLPPGRRAFHRAGVAILFTASVAYLAMASNLGKTPVLVEFFRQGSHLYNGPAEDAYRSIWYARYIDWTITTPLLLLELLLGTGMPLSGIFFTVFMDLLMIETGLIGSLIVSSYKWGFYALGCVAMLYVFYQLIVPARKNAYALSPEAGKAYTASAFVLSILWLLYPIAWGLADGGNVISPDSEMIFYGILDVLAKPGFLLFHLFALRNVDYTSFELQSGHYSVGARDMGEHEKHNFPFMKNKKKVANGTAPATNRDSMQTAVA